jgi:hypothetical protein
MARNDSRELTMQALDGVLEELRLERMYQAEQWDPGDPANPYGTRSFEEWLILTYTYAHEALLAYTHNRGNSEAREKLLKAVNVGLWGLQSTRANR